MWLRRRKEGNRTLYGINGNYGLVMCCYGGAGGLFLFGDEGVASNQRHRRGSAWTRVGFQRKKNLLQVKNKK